MKPQIIIGLIFLVISLMAGLSYAAYQVGVNKTVAKYSKDVAKITEKALREREELQTKLDEISHEYFTASSNERARITELQRQLRSKPATVECVESPGGGFISIIPSDTVRLLVESASYQALPEATIQSCPFSETDAVTADLFTEYTVCIIGIYNEVAGQLTGLIDSIDKYSESLE